MSFIYPLIIGIFENFQALCVYICLENTTIPLFGQLKLKFTNLKLIRLLRKFTCRHLYVLVINAVILNQIGPIASKYLMFKVQALLL